MKISIRKEPIIVAMFLLALILPLSGMMFKLDQYKIPWKHPKPAVAPELTLSIRTIQKFPDSFTRYFNDNFGFRNALIRVNAFIKFNLLGVSPSSESVIGKDGWLFYALEGPIVDYPGVTNYDLRSLDKWARTLEIKRAWLEKQGIGYIFVVAPNKSTIYGEFLPDVYKLSRNAALDQFYDYVIKHTKVEIVDTQKALLAAKPKERVYHKTDTHWNAYGAFIACNQVMKSVAKRFPLITLDSLENYTVTKKMIDGMVLASMMGGPEFIRENSIMLEHKHNAFISFEYMDRGSTKPVLFSQNAPTLPRTIIFHDSFFRSVAPFLAPHFQYSRYYWQNWNTSTPIEDIISSQKPDIIIEEVAEWFIKDMMVDFVDEPPDYIIKSKR